MVKTLDQINREFFSACAVSVPSVSAEKACVEPELKIALPAKPDTALKKEGPQKKHFVRRLAGAASYAAVFGLVVMLFVSSLSQSGRSVSGYTEPSEAAVEPQAKIPSQAVDIPDDVLLPDGDAEQPKEDTPDNTAAASHTVGSQAGSAGPVYEAAGSDLQPLRLRKNTDANYGPDEYGPRVGDTRDSNYALWLLGYRDRFDQATINQPGAIRLRSILDMDDFTGIQVRANDPAMEGMFSIQKAKGGQDMAIVYTYYPPLEVWNAAAPGAPTVRTTVTLIREGFAPTTVTLVLRYDGSYLG